MAKCAWERSFTLLNTTHCINGDGECNKQPEPYTDSNSPPEPVRGKRCPEQSGEETCWQKQLEQTLDGNDFRKSDPKRHRQQCRKCSRT